MFVLIAFCWLYCKTVLSEHAKLKHLIVLLIVRQHLTSKPLLVAKKT